MKAGGVGVGVGGVGNYYGGYTGYGYSHTPRSTLYILAKYAVFLNWTLTGFWIIYNSSEYSRNAAIISEKISSYSDQIEKEHIVYCLISYTIILSSITFFGLVGVCYENLCLTLSLASAYAVYIAFDVVWNALLGVPFDLFLLLLIAMLSLTCANLFFFAALIRSHLTSQQQHLEDACNVLPIVTTCSAPPSHRATPSASPQPPSSAAPATTSPPAAAAAPASSTSLSNRQLHNRTQCSERTLESIPLR